MKPGDPTGPAIVGLYRIDRFAIEVAVAANELGATFPLVRVIVTGVPPGPWIPAHMFALLSQAAHAVQDLTERGVFKVKRQTPPLLDALGGALPESRP